MRTADDIFCSELAQRRIAYSETTEGLYEIQIGEQKVTVSLENIRRNYDRDGDADAIVRFIEQIENVSINETPVWEDVRPFIRYSLEPADYETGFDDVVVNSITEDLIQVYVYSSSDGSRMTWINESTLAKWDVTRDLVVQQAEENMASIVAQATFKVDHVDGNKLGMISTEETPFKASLILSSSFREFVEQSHGWPVYVVVPCRDFVYVVPHDNQEFLGRLGGVVIDEYRKSGYSITKDVLLVSDDGVTAIGTYPDPE